MEIRLCAFADEASKEFERQLDVLNEENIPYIELRGLDGTNVSDLTEEQAREYKKLLDAKGIKVWSIGSPLGKINLDGDHEAHFEKARHTFRLARIFDTTRIRMFSYYNVDYDKDEQKVFDNLKKMVEIAREEGVVLYHENEKGIYGDLAVRVEKLLDNVDGLECIFDPANYVQCGQNIEDALDLLAKKTGYFHIKDALVSGEVVPSGKGDGNIDLLVKSIDKDVTLTLEPHLAVFEGYSHIDHTELKNKYVFNNAREAFAAAVDALKTILKNNGFVEENKVWKK